MLPITHQRVFHIPHSLATLAAIAALITALSWNPVDDAEPAEMRAAGETSVISAGQAASAAPEQVSESAEPPARVDCRSCAGTGLSNLLPLVLPGMSTR